MRKECVPTQTKSFFSLILFFVLMWFVPCQAHFCSKDLWCSEKSFTDNLYSVWGSSANNVFAVGAEGAILHYDGSSWSKMDSGITSRLSDVWGSSANNIFAVGAEGAILHYDGSSWSKMDSGVTSSLWGVWGSSANNVFAVGAEGVILHKYESPHPHKSNRGLPGALLLLLKKKP